MFKVDVIADSISPTEARLTTVAATYPRIILAEVNTYRAWSRNTASSRAIPVAKRIEAVKTDPFVPREWGTNQPGMVAGAPLTESDARLAEETWLWARDGAVMYAEGLLHLGVHKQIVNRLLEPFSWVTSVITATDFENCFAQRIHEAAQPEFHVLAQLLQEALEASRPVLRSELEPWQRSLHLPWVDEDERSTLLMNTCLALSVARCARVSYLNHDKTHSVEADLKVFDKMVDAQPPHWSPFEHQARAMENKYAESGNFTGWEQYRKLYYDEGGPMEVARWKLRDPEKQTRAGRMVDWELGSVA